MHFRPLIIVASALLLAGCAEQQPRSYATYSSPGYSGGDVISSPATTAPAMDATDALLASRVRQNLDANTLNGISRNINVYARNGEVTLSGSVPNDRERHQVDEVARNTTGVTKVYDQLALVNDGSLPRDDAPVYSPPPAVAPTGREYYPTAQTPPPVYGNTVATGDIFNLHVQGLNDTDRHLAERILHNLRTDTALVSILPVVNIHVVNGRVVLDGSVENEQQRQTIAAVVARAAGPGNVENQLQIVR